MVATVLMVAEKPSVSQSIAAILSNGQFETIPAKCPVHIFDGEFLGRPAKFKMTCVIGHVYGTDFPQEYQNWDQTEPERLFDAPVLKKEANPGAKVCQHLQRQAKDCEHLVLWLDCDREGENICFEVIDNTVPFMAHRHNKVYRARFSSITAPDIKRAMSTLGTPNENEALAVDARQELDLKIGVAFTRFQTRYFQGKYGDLDSSLISYGPCQTPTLGFCVKRHDLIQSFIPEPYWRIGVTVVTPRGGQRLRLEWERERIFDRAVASIFYGAVSGTKRATLVNITSREKTRPRPQALNTVELLKIASKLLGIGPHTAMQLAEGLYTAGFISYPRTESTQYSPHFDLTGTLREQANHPDWGAYVRRLLETGPKQPRSGVDVGDHPPITPMRSATQMEIGGGDRWRLYEYITRHFIAGVSADCRYSKTHATFSIGEERFTCSAKRMTFAGFTEVLPSLAVRDERLGLEQLEKGESIAVADLDLEEGKTTPPDHLTESELIGLMEKYGIGTDASIPVHINNICQRNYATIQGGSRMVVPTKLGVVLVHAYYRIDPELVLPKVRAHIEQEIGLVANGEADKAAVVQHALAVFKAKFAYFVKNIEDADALFESSFSPLTATGKPFTRCGKCFRYMKLIMAKPTRLHCSHCEETYLLPQNGTIKQYMQYTCPLDGFELVIFSLGRNGKAFPLCPMCYNNVPPFDDSETRKLPPPKAMGCNACQHPTCRHAAPAPGHMLLEDCPECDVGSLVVDVISQPKEFKIHCNRCNFLAKMSEALVKNMLVLPFKDGQCDHCGAALVKLKFRTDGEDSQKHSKKKGAAAGSSSGGGGLPRRLTELGVTKSKYTGCIFCDELLNDHIVEWKQGRQRHQMYSRGRGGKRRGRGGRRRRRNRDDDFDF